jgi:hypothetical protein
VARIFVVSLEDFPTGRAIERDSQMVSEDVPLNAPGFAELFIASLEGAAEFTWRCYVALVSGFTSEGPVASRTFKR